MKERNLHLQLVKQATGPKLRNYRQERRLLRLGEGELGCHCRKVRLHQVRLRRSKLRRPRRATAISISIVAARTGAASSTAARNTPPAAWTITRAVRGASVKAPSGTARKLRTREASRIRSSPAAITTSVPIS